MRQAYSLVTNDYVNVYGTPSPKDIAKPTLLSPFDDALSPSLSCVGFGGQWGLLHEHCVAVPQLR